MNRRVHAHGAPDEAGSNGVDGGGRLGELSLPVTVAWGEYENSEQAAICELLVERIPGARRVVLPGTAHLPGLDAPGRAGRGDPDDGGASAAQRRYTDVGSEALRDRPLPSPAITSTRPDASARRPRPTASPDPG